jgi:DNA (cytosine-5)-methyltransferase 1
MGCPSPRVIAIDLFCGAGGLAYGLQQAGISVAAGIDVDPECRYPFETNNDAAFLERDVRQISDAHLNRLWPADCVRLLAGCAPCQPFSPHRRGADTSGEDDWALLHEFARLVHETRPELVTMENVPRVGTSKVFLSFVQALKVAGYDVSWRSCRAVEYGLAQERRRLVLMASLLGPIAMGPGPWRDSAPATVRDVIGDLPSIKAGERDPHDPMHVSRALSPLNIKRLRASSPGGTWAEWPEELRAPCHRRDSGRTFRNPYGRMEWNRPSPTITTLAYNYGTGRFGHPEQDRALSLREAALLQGFPRDYEFVRPGDPVAFLHLGRLIGNAVPPPLGRAIGDTIVGHLTDIS